MFNTKLKASLLLVQIFVVSTCSLTYELLIGTASTNITGNSILAFSLAIGLFLAGLGLGAFASRWVQDEVLVQRFVLTETTLALVGGIGVILLYGAFVFSPHFELVKTILTLLIGFFSGLEIPILTRILQKQEDSKLKSILANVLSFDYLGGLAASLLFPLILLPYFGLVRLSFLVGIINCLMPALAIFLEQNPDKNAKIAVLGGGDGLAVRELLKFEDFIDQIYLIDLDKGVTDLAQNSHLLKDLNQNSLSNSKVKVINTDAWSWIQEQPKNSLDIIINDFPDPDETVVSKLYSQEFFRFIYRVLTPKGVLTTQSTSSYATPKAFWGIHKTLNSVFTTTKPYNVYIPSFGLWGFNLAIKEGDFMLNKDLQNPNTKQILQTNQFINQEGVSKIFVLEPDILQPKLKNGQQIDLNELKINTLDNLILTNYYAQAGQEVY